MATITIGEQDFLLDSRPHQIISGAMHYFRVHPEQWADRLRKARLMGLNTIETYVAWNAHAPQRGTFDTTGRLDLGRFLDLIAAEGMHAIVRPGPYICAEWTNGGLPSWLFTDPSVGVRRNEPQYLDAIAEYLDQLAPILVPRQVDRGGPVVLVQVENEYGAYGDDASYLERLVELHRGIGLTVPFITVDQPQPEMLERGSIPGLHRTASFGSRVTERLATLRRHQPTGPLMCSEFWCGWFDHWGAHHHTTDAASSARELDVLLAAGASVNIYMFHGGTNFGLTNGANDKGAYQPYVTSYDYDAPLDEAGDPTAKYWAFREVIARYAPVPDEKPAMSGPAPELVVELEGHASLWSVTDDLGEQSPHDELPTMDDLGIFEGFVLYSADIAADGSAVFDVDEVRDRAHVFVDQRPVGVLEREQRASAISLPDDVRGRLDVLVEDQGRVNYGPRIGEAKGLIGSARLNGQTLGRWCVRPLDIGRLDAVRPRLVPNGPVVGPAYRRGGFTLDAPADLFLDTSGWGKGVVWINGSMIGRYWSAGPQRTLYVPAPFLTAGANEIIVLELHGAARPTLRFVARPDLGHTDF
ncbi:beta-galactosidase [Agromyces sp. SYSU K20354]|uniref:glycoside hydrolase family 35 protein n=1 Tax=Agromyces cavernae TaxID=2898659 RepID=UPI001E2DAFE7|nr:beta-galactosidase family protein [Agromyces cavernae]MCD2443014.1 beta-galactosidase [Agromyces cavernae]